MPGATSHAREPLRRTLRARRRALTGTEREAAETRLIRRLKALPAYRRARHVAVYLAVDGEVDLRALLPDARRRGIAIYAPLLADDRLSFRVLEPDCVLTVNRYGISEPQGTRAIDPRSLDLVLAPMVGFDCAGARLGMGKGYYDRSLSFLRLRARWRKPKLIGIGFEFQQVSTITTEPWDIGLWAAVTDTATHYFVLEKSR